MGAITDIEIVLCGFIAGAAFAIGWTIAEYVRTKREYSREIDAEYFLLCLSEG